MKLAVILLMCFVSATWQQNAFWSYPNRLLPFYSNNFGDLLQNNFPTFSSGPVQQDYPVGIRHILVYFQFKMYIA